MIGPLIIPKSSTCTGSDSQTYWFGVIWASTDRLWEVFPEKFSLILSLTKGGRGCLALIFEVFWYLRLKRCPFDLTQENKNRKTSWHARLWTITFVLFDWTLLLCSCWVDMMKHWAVACNKRRAHCAIRHTSCTALRCISLLGRSIYHVKYIYIISATNLMSI